MKDGGYPTLYQINTRAHLTDLSTSLGRPATLDDIPDVELDRLADRGFDWVWLLSVWQTGLAGQRISQSNPEWRHEFQETSDRTCGKTTSPVPASRLLPTRCIVTWAATPHWPGCAIGCGHAG